MFDASSPFTADDPDHLVVSCLRCGRSFPNSWFHGVCPRCAATELLGVSCEQQVDHPIGSTRSSASAQSQQIGAYDLITELGRGGGGIVYRALETGLNREVALKVLLDGHFSDAISRRRFLLEAEVGAELDHPNIVPVFVLGEDRGRPYCAMKLVHGGSLAKALDADPHRYSPREAAELILMVSRGVQHAHERGILHRDIKPSNILLESPLHPRIADFGLARRRERDQELTGSGAAPGTPAYMAPEQLEGHHDLTTAVDIWGIGVVFYQLLAGRLPFDGVSPTALARSTLESTPPPPLTVRARMRGTREIRNSLQDRDLQVICLKCLEKRPEARYPTANALAADLERAIRGHPIQARPAKTTERVVRWIRRRPLVAVLVLLLLVALVTIGVGTPLFALRIDRARSDAVQANARLQQALDRMETAFISERTPGASIADALAMTAYRLRKTPGSASDVERALFLLTKYRFAFPIQVLHPSDDTHFWLMSRDGKWIVTYDAKKHQLVTREVSTGRAIHVRTLHQTVSPGGAPCEASDRFLAIHDSVEHFEILKLPGGIPCATLPAPERSSAKAVFSSDGRWLAISGRSKETTVWDTSTWNLVLALPNDTSSLDLLNPGPLTKAVAFSPDGGRLAIGSYGGRVDIYRLPDGLQLATGRHSAPVSGVLFNNTGELVASTANAAVQVVDLSDNATYCSWALDDSTIHGIKFGPDGETLWLGAQNGTLQQWNFRDRSSSDVVVRVPMQGAQWMNFEVGGNSVLASVKGDACSFNMKDARVVGVLPSPLDGSQIVLGASKSGRGIVTLQSSEGYLEWDFPVSPPIEYLLPHNAEVIATRFSHSGNQLATVGWSGEIFVWDLKGEFHIGPKWRFEQGTRAWQARFSPDDAFLATSGWDSPVRIWDLQVGRLSKSLIQSDSSPWWIDYTPNGSRLLTAGGWTSKAPDPPAAIQGWDTRRQTRLFQTGRNRFVWQPALSPDGELWVVPDRSSESVASPNSTAELRVLRTVDGTDAIPPLCFAGIRGEHPLITSTAFSPDGNWIAAGSIHQALIWDVRSGALRWRLPHRQAIRAVRFHNDGRRFLTAGEDSTAILWDLDTGKPSPNAVPMRHLPGTEAPLINGQGIKAALFSPNGRWIATGAADHTARLWDAGTGFPITEPLRHGGPVMTVEFSPDGRWLLTGSTDRTAKLWRLFFASEPVQPWIPELLEALARRRLSEDGQFQPVDREAFFRSLEEAKRAPPVGVWAEVLAPYLSPRERE